MKALVQPVREASFVAVALLVGLSTLYITAVYDAGCMRRSSAAASRGIGLASAAPFRSPYHHHWHAGCHSRPEQLVITAQTVDQHSSSVHETPALHYASLPEQSNNIKWYTYYSFVEQLAFDHPSLWRMASTLRTHVIANGPMVAFTAAAVHASDTSLALVMALPQLLVAMWLAAAVLSYSSMLSQADRSNGSATSTCPPVQGSTPTERSVSSNALSGNSGSSRSSWQSSKHMWVLAAVKLLPATAGVVHMLLGKWGLLIQQYGSSQHLQLQHWSTPLLMACLTALSQAQPMQKAMISLLHLLLAAVLLVSGPSSSSAVTDYIHATGAAASIDLPAQQQHILLPLLALMLVDLVLVPVLACAHEAFSRRSSGRVSALQQPEQTASVPRAEPLVEQETNSTSKQQDSMSVQRQPQPLVQPAEQQQPQQVHADDVGVQVSTGDSTGLQSTTAQRDRQLPAAPGGHSHLGSNALGSVSNGSSCSSMSDPYQAAEATNDSSSSQQDDSSELLSSQQREMAASDGSDESTDKYIKMTNMATAPSASMLAGCSVGTASSSPAATARSKSTTDTESTAVAAAKRQSGDITHTDQDVALCTCSMHPHQPVSAAAAVRTGPLSPPLPTLPVTTLAGGPMPTTSAPAVPQHACSYHSAVHAASPDQVKLLGLPPQQQQRIVQLQLAKLQQLSSVAPPTGPALSCDVALAAIQEGAAAGSAGYASRRALYSSPVQHHSVGVKVPLAQAQQGQQLVELLAQQFAAAHVAATAAGTTTVSPPTAAPPAGQHSAELMLLPPVAVVGCFHLLLSVAAPHGASTTSNMPIRRLVSGRTAEQGPGGCSRTGGAQEPSSAAQLHPAASDHSPGVATSLALQIDSQGPVCVTRQPDGRWTVTGSSAAAAATAAQAYESVAAAVGEAPLSASGCRLDPPCVRLNNSAGSSSSSNGASKAANAAAGQAESVEVTVYGLPAAAGPAARVLLVQGVQVVVDEVVPLQRCQSVEEEGKLTARLVLSSMQLKSGPAVVYVLGTGGAPPAVRGETARRSSFDAAALLGGAAATAAAHSTRPLPLQRGSFDSATASLASARAAAPLHKASALGTLAAGSLVPAMSTGTGSNSSSSRSGMSGCFEVPRSATLWACMPVLFVGSAAAHRQLLTLFNDMACELLEQQQQQQAPKERGPRVTAGVEASSSGVATWCPPYKVPGSDTGAAIADVSGSSSSSRSMHAVYQQLHLQHWQPMLWDWLYAAQATDTTCIGNITALAAALKDRTAQHDAAATPLSAEAQAPAAAAAAANTSEASSSQQAQLHTSKQLLATELITLLGGRGLKEAAHELLTHLAAAAAARAVVSGTAASNGAVLTERAQQQATASAVTPATPTTGDQDGAPTVVPSLLQCSRGTSSDNVGAGDVPGSVGGGMTALQPGAAADATAAAALAGSTACNRLLPVGATGGANMPRRGGSVADPWPGHDNPEAEQLLPATARAVGLDNVAAAPAHPAAAGLTGPRGTGLDGHSRGRKARTAVFDSSSSIVTGNTAPAAGGSNMSRASSARDTPAVTAAAALTAGRRRSMGSIPAAGLLLPLYSPIASTVLPLSNHFPGSSGTPSNMPINLETQNHRMVGHIGMQCIQGCPAAAVPGMPPAATTATGAIGADSVAAPGISSSSMERLAAFERSPRLAGLTAGIEKLGLMPLQVDGGSALQLPDKDSAAARSSLLLHNDDSSSEDSGVYATAMGFSSAGILPEQQQQQQLHEEWPLNPQAERVAQLGSNATQHSAGQASAATAATNAAANVTASTADDETAAPARHAITASVPPAAVAATAKAAAPGLLSTSRGDASSGLDTSRAHWPAAAATVHGPAADAAEAAAMHGPAVAAGAGGGAGSSGGDDGCWHVFDTTGLEGFDAGLTSEAHHLMSTRRITSVTSTTWFAVPTNSASTLPPTPRSAAHLRTPSVYGSTGKQRRDMYSDSRHTAPHGYASTAIYSHGAGYTPTSVTHASYTPGGVSSSSHHGPSSSHTPTGLTPGRGGVAPGIGAASRGAAAAAAAEGHGQTPSGQEPQGAGKHTNQHATVARSKSQRKLLLFSPVRAGEGAAMAANTLQGRVPPAAGAFAGGWHGVPAPTATGGGGLAAWVPGSTPVRSSHPGTAGGSEGLCHPQSVVAAAARGGPFDSVPPLMTPRRAQLPSSGLQTPRRSVPGLPPSGYQTPVRCFTGLSGLHGSQAGSVQQTPGRSMSALSGLHGSQASLAQRTPGRSMSGLPSLHDSHQAHMGLPAQLHSPYSTPTRQPMVQQQQQTPGASGSMFNTWASNLSAGNQDTVDTVLDLLGGAGGAPGVSTPLYSKTHNSKALSSSSSSGGFLDAEEEGPAPGRLVGPQQNVSKSGHSHAGSGGYFIPIRPYRAARMEGLLGSSSTSNAAAALAQQGLGVAGPASAAAAAAGAATRHGVRGFTPARPLPVARPGDLLVEECGDSEEEDDSPVTRAGKSISGALFTGGDLVGIASRPRLEFSGSNSFAHMQPGGRGGSTPSMRRSSPLVSATGSSNAALVMLPNICASGPDGRDAGAAAAAAAHLPPGLAHFPPATSTGRLQAAQQLPRLSTGTIVGMDFDDDGVHTPVHTPVHSPIHSSPAHTPPEQIMHSHTFLWASPESSIISSSPSTPTHATGSCAGSVGSPAPGRAGTSGRAGSLPDGSSFAKAAAAAAFHQADFGGSAPGSRAGRGAGTPRHHQQHKQHRQHHHAVGVSPAPPPAPLRPLPAVMLVPACEADPELAMSIEGLLME